MTSDTSDLDQRLQFTIDLARRAGDLALSYFRALDTLTIESKGHQDLVSNADREVELFVRAALAEAYPDDGIVGEEHAEVAGRSGFVWVIDPIDGTANFVRGIPAWTVVIACVRDRQPVVGVTHEPSTSETFWARKGGGAFVNGRALAVSQAASIRDGSVATGFSTRVDGRRAVEVISALVEGGGVFFRNASGALMLAYVAAGRLIGYTEQHMNGWDCLSGILLVSEAGGVVEPYEGVDPVRQGILVIAAGPHVFAEIRSLSAGPFGLSPA
jgi:myo-inositol-1(or 4)-monophosphatase